MDWQPIDSAPKDGRHVLLTERHHPDDYPTSVVNAFWGDRFAGYREDSRENYSWINWHEGFEYIDEGALWATVKNPTHWMPLPKAPDA